MSRWKSFGVVTILLTTFGPGGSLADADSHRQAVEQLFELTRLQQKIDTSVTNVLALQLQQNPALGEHEALLRSFLEEQIGWSSMKNELVSMYMAAFTEPELAEINAFYSTPAGQKLIQRLPELIQQRDQLAMQRMQENIDELQQKFTASSTPQ
jgi:hypothetical protein